MTHRAITAQLSRLMRKFDVPNRAGLIAAVMSAAGVGLPVGAVQPASGYVAQPLRDAEGRVVGLLHIGAEAAEG